MDGMENEGRFQKHLTKPQPKVSRSVHHIVASSRAFVAILADGSVVTWGEAHAGGDCSRVYHRLKGEEGRHTVDGSEIPFPSTWHGAETL